MKLTLQFLLVIFASSLYSQTSETKYFRHLRYNHVSPYIEITGIHPIDKITAESTSHYVFKYDNSGALVELLNNHYHTEKRHPLASVGVFRIEISYADNKEIRKFYDPNGKRVSNDRNVYKEVLTYDDTQKKSNLQFFDLDDQPMESNWKIAEYQWEHGVEFVIEHRYNLINELVNVSPYFEFGITGIDLDKEGLPKGHYNLNSNYQVVDNSDGVASYRDDFDDLGNHVMYSYYDASDKLTLNQWGFAVGVKSYDDNGNNILLEQLDTEGEAVRSRPIYSNSEIDISEPTAASDSSEIRRISLGYLMALQKLDPELMDEVMNDSLNKVTIGYNREIKKEIAKATTRAQMMAFAEDWNKSNTKFPSVPNNDVRILGIYDRIASVELVSDNWVEYLHLINLNGKWQIINLVWQHKDINRYPR